MKRFAGAILVDKDGGVLLQRRDDIPTIKDPNLLNIFAGAALNGETKEQTAIRELREETGLDIANKMRFFKEFIFEDAPSDVFIVNDVDVAEIVIGEGQGVERLADYDEFIKHDDLTSKTKVILEEYYASL